MDPNGCTQNVLVYTEEQFVQISQQSKLRVYIELP